jgi:hypothetical protein
MRGQPSARCRWKLALLSAQLLTGGHISLNLHKIETCEYRHVAFEFRLVARGSRSAPLALSQWRRSLTISHHFEFLYERPRRSHRRRQMLIHFLSRWRGIIRDVPSSAPWPAKQERPAGGWPAEPPPTIKSVQYLCEEGRQRESSQNYENYPFLYSCMPYAYFTPVKLKAPRGRFLRWGGIFLNNASAFL